jgi:hypothetical protein
LRIDLRRSDCGSIFSIIPFNTNFAIRVRPFPEVRQLREEFLSGQVLPEILSIFPQYLRDSETSSFGMRFLIIIAIRGRSKRIVVDHQKERQKSTV